jgi:hypothetical protein
VGVSKSNDVNAGSRGFASKLAEIGAAEELTGAIWIGTDGVLNVSKID